MPCVCEYEKKTVRDFFVKFFCHIKRSILVVIAPEYGRLRRYSSEKRRFIVIDHVSEGRLHYGRQRAVIVAAFKTAAEFFKNFMKSNFEIILNSPARFYSRAVHQDEFVHPFGIKRRKINFKLK